MNLVLKRLEFTAESTIGRLAVDGADFCWTLEDYLRIGPKVHGKTAIPTGRYSILLTMSPRFKRVLPLLLDVPNFTGVRIHPGNTDDDTEGCILVGFGHAKDQIMQSRLAFDALFGKLSLASKRGELLSIEIS